MSQSQDESPKKPPLIGALLRVPAMAIHRKLISGGFLGDSSWDWDIDSLVN